ncbi:hypothetical protein BXY64_2526 [Marinifilum flexuosum]|uniref:Uncharacterized protein n=1 Tax=Marinifilum flexuosum TaxID=1117708 RepID=A0A419X3Z7_9BACT|nr:hypothetical protein BXY64_2526 [Marinifilum flexuosum]
MDDFFVIKNFKSSQPKGCSGFKLYLALNSAHILGYSKSPIKNCPDIRIER